MICDPQDQIGNRGTKQMTVRLVYDLPETVKCELDWLQYLLRDFNVQPIFDREHRVVDDNVILAASCSSPGQAALVRQHLQAFKRCGLKVGLFHLSDEYGFTPVDIYDHADFVFRNYYRRNALRRPNCRYFALGYQSGFTQSLTHKPIAQRRYTWSFAGQLKSNRASMLEQANTVPGGYYRLTTKWNDPDGLDITQYAALLSDTVFALCPRGSKSVDCFRVYEALEAGAIPIVEDRSTTGSILDILRPGGMQLISTLHPRDLWPNLKTHGLASYWTAAYGSDFPCPRLSHWQNLSALIKSHDSGKKSLKIQQWWQAYKSNLAQVISTMVKQTFPN
jgi:hypothetical protein